MQLGQLLLNGIFIPPINFGGMGLKNCVKIKISTTAYQTADNQAYFGSQNL